ncbi:MAG: hypothetical protein AAF581_12530 [Planctomycetota bacterium]
MALKLALKLPQQRPLRLPRKPASAEPLRVARALQRLPELRSAFADGLLSYAQVRAITRVATPQNVAALARAAEKCSATQFWSFALQLRRTEAQKRKRSATFSGAGA